MVQVLKADVQSTDLFEIVWTRGSILTSSLNIPAPIERRRRRCREVAENNRVWTKHNYKDMLLDPLVEKLMNELNHRFSDESNSILTSISSLFPSSDNFFYRDALVPFADFYGLTGSIGAEIQVYKTQLQEQGVTIKCENGSPWGIRDVLQFLMPYREAYRQLYKAYSIAATLPVTSATNEKSFSCLDLI